MENPFAYFEKIYCINLSEDTEKWMVTIQLDKAGKKGTRSRHQRAQ